MQRIRTTHIRITIEAGRLCLDLHTEQGELIILEALSLEEIEAELHRAREFIESGGLDLCRPAIDRKAAPAIDCAQAAVIP